MKHLLIVGFIVGVMSAQTAQATSIGPISNTWTGTELTQTDRLFRDGVASSCATPKTYPGFLASGTQQSYASFDFINTSASAACMVVTWSGDPNYDTFLSAFTYPYNPLEVATTYLGDAGQSANTIPASFSFLVPAGTAFSIVANTIVGPEGSVGAGFTFTIDGEVAKYIIPEPASLLLLGTGLIGLRAWRKRRP